MVSKYVDHQPLYRLENSILAREGIRDEPLHPVRLDGRWQRVGGAGRGSDEEGSIELAQINTDDTTVPVLDKNRQTTKPAICGPLWR